MSIISFKPDSLKKFSESKKTPLEKIEDIELLRALEIGLKIKTFNLKGDSFSVDVLDDYKRAKKQMGLDKFFKLKLLSFNYIVDFDNIFFVISSSNTL